jgi:hypothetical protein
MFACFQMADRAIQMHLISLSMPQQSDGEGLMVNLLMTQVACDYDIAILPSCGYHTLSRISTL